MKPKRKQFEIKYKLRIMRIIKSRGIDEAIIIFVNENYGRYIEEFEKYKGVKRKYRNPPIIARARLNSWLNKYNSFGAKGLISMSGKNKKPNAGRRKVLSILELSDNDKEYYQHIMESVLADHGITQADILKKIQEEKEKTKKGKKPNNIANAMLALRINRSSFYSNYKKKKNSKLTPQDKKEKYWDPKLVTWINHKIYLSDGTIGRDKLLIDARNEGFLVSSYAFRVMLESLEYKSSAYIRKSNRPPKEDKYSEVWCEDFVQGKFDSSFEQRKWFADVSYIQINKQWYFLHMIIDSFGNNVINWSLSQSRKASDTIRLVKDAINKCGYKPQIFHTDHGIEYANYQFKDFLNQNGITQSMSPKGNSLANRPSEFFFSLIKREKLCLYNLDLIGVEGTKNKIEEYLRYYTYDRIQRNLCNKKPGDFLVGNPPALMCLNFVS